MAGSWASAILQTPPPSKLGENRKVGGGGGEKKQEPGIPDQGTLLRRAPHLVRMPVTLTAGPGIRLRKATSKRTLSGRKVRGRDR